MTSTSKNMFQRLRKWATRQDENFLTESLAVVLEQLLVIAPNFGVGLVKILTGGFIDLPAEKSNEIEIQTQVVAEYGRPDLEIRCLNQLVYIEVKVESFLRDGQIGKYRRVLWESGIKRTRLVLLSRYSELFQTDDLQPDLLVRWFDIAEWIEDNIPIIGNNCEVGAFLMKQLHDFLGVRGMTLNQVGNHMPEGVRDLVSLMNMLSETASACKLSKRQQSSWNDMGLSLEESKYWLGVNFTESQYLIFNTQCNTDPEAAAKLDIGEMIEGTLRWQRWIDLDSEPVHFFSRTKVSQMKWLEGFLRESLEMARSIIFTDQSAIANKIK